MGRESKMKMPKVKMRGTKTEQMKSREYGSKGVNSRNAIVGIAKLSKICIYEKLYAITGGISQFRVIGKT
jgi:hypothetical protein